MKCPECGSLSKKVVRDIQLLDERAGPIEIGQAEFWECRNCGSRLYTADTASRISDGTQRRIEALVRRRPLGVGKSLRHPRLWTKGTHDLSPTQVHRADALAQRLNQAFSPAEGLSDGCLSFSPPVPHGQQGRGGTVMMTRIEDGKEVFVHASDIQMLNDEAIEQILTWQPTVVLASGPPIYLPSLTLEKRESALRRTLMVAGEVNTLILDHHLMRSKEGEKWLDWVSSITDHKVVCAADFMGCDRNLLEAERVLWYKKMPVPKGWHEAYARGEADTKAYQGVR